MILALNPVGSKKIAAHLLHTVFAVRSAANHFDSGCLRCFLRVGLRKNADRRPNSEVVLRVGLRKNADRRQILHVFLRVGLRKNADRRQI
jgi:hypothetical protein